MSELKVKVSRPVNDGIINLSVKAVDEQDVVAWEYARNFDMNAVGYSDLPPLAQVALSEGFGKALREATGGLTVKADSEKRVDARLAAWAGGEWGASAEGGEAVAYSVNAVESVALASAYPQNFATSGDAAAFLNQKIEAAIGKPFADLDEKARAKAKKAFREQVIEKDGKLALAIADETTARAKAAAERARARMVEKANAATGSLIG